MRLFRKITSKSLLCLLFLMIFLFSASVTAAQDGFYVIPVKKNNYAPVPITGQTTSYATGDDGDLQMGVSWPEPRFIDNDDGTVTDKLTDLIWLKNANCPNGEKLWSDGLTFANSLYDGWTGDGSGGDCGLSDGSSAGAWRLPNIKELQSLIDFGRHSPAVPAGRPFTSVQSSYYWSSTTDAIITDDAWLVRIENGSMAYTYKGSSSYVWPVRGGND